jgi:SAM-dependent methyltransferase
MARRHDAEVKNWFAGERATNYDDPEQLEFDPAVIAGTADFLAEVAAGGTALEFAIGTGRVALPMAARGVEVAGIELSEDMVAQLRQKPGGADLEVVVGDMTSATAPRVGSYSLVYLVYNTIGNVETQERQVECFVNGSRHLAVGGCFVIEVVVPQLQRLAAGERFVPFMVPPTHAGIDELDVVTQAGVSHHYLVGPEGRGGVFSTPWRYVWPSELDLMARLAGMRLRERWGDWDRSAFTARSWKHVSVWEKVGPWGES